MTGSYWTCRRKTLGTPCGRVNPGRVQKCRACDGRKPVKRKPAHMRALDVPYAEYIKLTGGEFCAICKREPSANRRLDRDHDHRTKKPRALLCHRCNRGLPNWATPEWLRLAAAYVERHLE